MRLRAGTYVLAIILALVFALGAACAIVFFVDSDELMKNIQDR
jgi:hypothetical protein